MSAPNIEDIYRLTPLQTGMLFHSLEDTDDIRPYTVQMVEEFTGPLHEEHFRTAWQRVIDRHTVLRTAFVWEGVSRPVQVVQRRARLPFARHDWRDLTDAEQRDRLDALIEADWNRGFDLTAAPLLRVTVIRTAEERRIVLWSFHHLLLDGWSVQQVLADLFRFYRAELAGESPAEPPAAPFVRYAEWLEAQSRDDARDFWRRHLDGIGAATTPGGDDTGQTGVDVVRFDCDDVVSERARAFAKAHRITVNTLVQGAWALLTSRYTRQPSVIFGSTVSGRTPALPDIESMVGLFINTLPVRVDVAEDAPVADWLREIQRQQAELRQYEYSALVDVHRWSGIPRGEPLFESILVFENYPESGEESGPPDGLRRRLVHCEERTGYPLTVVAWSGRRLAGKLVYDRSRFHRSTVEGIAGHLRNLLAAIVGTDDGDRIGDVSMLDAAERRRVLHDWNTAVADFPGDKTIHRLIEERARAVPDAVAVRHGNASLTFRELDDRADRLAHRLRTSGARPGVLIGVCLDHGLDAVVSLLAVLKSGAAFVPLDPAYPASRLEFMLDDTEAPLLITTTDVAERLPATAAEQIRLDVDWPGILAGEPDIAPRDVASPHDLAYVIYTSGSTGRPKGVMLEHHGVVNYLHWCDTAYPARGDVGTFLYSSITFDLTITALFLPLIQGGSIAIPVPAPGATAFQATVERLLEGVEVGFLKATPSHLELLVTLAEQGGNRLRIHSIVAGGEELTSALARRIIAVSDVDVTITNEYGATEGSVANVMSATTADTSLNRHAVDCGRAVDNTSVYVVDPTGRPVPVGVPGEALLGGVCVARGYHRRPALNRERFTPNPFGPGRVYHTGDLVRWLPGGRIEFIGRMDDQVKLRGYRIELGEIDAALRDQPGVTSAVTMLREDVPGDKRIVAYLVGDTDTGVIRGRLAERLPGHMIPSDFVVVDVLPLTTNGKVDRAALPAPSGRRTGPGPVHRPPRTDTERTVARVWADVLGVDRVGAEDDFFALGGHSITAITTAGRLKASGLPATVQSVMRHPVLADLARVLDGAGQTPTGLAIPLSAEHSGDQRPILFCVHPGGGGVHPYRTLARELADTHRVYGIQAAGLDGTEDPITGIEAMAGRYWREVEAVQPEGPYHLLGWSTGGVVVHEMAARRPDDVATVVILEPAVTGPSERDRFAGHARNREAADALWRRGRRARGPERADIERRLRELAVAAEIDPAAMNLDEFLPFGVLAAELRSLETYSAAVSRARTTLVVGGDYRDPTVVPTSGGGDHDGYVAHWRAHCPGGLDLLDVPAGHMGMVTDPESVARVVTALRRQPVPA
ncbi:amino acid adenylation domain-containing protein [Stackebrandtia albiflava]|uniref:amino acid adenylation domain-containing protein n=1 Tax=Stackebrandtia albiflava TaxID=406432 RepID=UPI0031ED2123